ncbi:hypothetical protein H5V45_08885 [Nocardioides sp. KIGAM211]|uniref:Sulfotransferase family protein n=1 Tax=Nocardioides luti TaxID=2761101 RepID=A0A7X0VAK3_9ACTN|nr:hypothetical protein [Nocardioides luti]MBB6627435.1 hypothetical protein [Nocardioides luti]
MNDHAGSLLPEGARLVHIGPHKTGSTAIQMAFFHAPEGLLEEHGVRYATGVRHRPDKAGWALGLDGHPAGAAKPPAMRWDQLVEKVTTAGRRRVCVSNEDFGRAFPQQVERIVSDFGRDQVHVISVARRLDRYLPSQWQERVKAGERRTFEEWLRLVLAPEKTGWEWRNVWFGHDIGSLVGRWTAEVPPERYTLVLSDETDRELIPNTFEDMLGLPRHTLKPDPARSNRGLAWSETELIRQVNMLFEEHGWDRAVRREFVRHGVLTDMGRRPTPEGPKNPPFPAWAVDRLHELGDRRVEQARSLGVRVVGDPEAMRTPDGVPVVDGPAVAPGVDAAVAAAALAKVVDVAVRSRAGAGKKTQEGSSA